MDKFWLTMRREKPISKCEWSDKYKTYIHKFDTGTNTCRCGMMSVPKPEYKNAWKRKEYNESLKTSAK